MHDGISGIVRQNVFKFALMHLADAKQMLLSVYVLQIYLTLLLFLLY